MLLEQWKGLVGELRSLGCIFEENSGTLTCPSLCFLSVVRIIACAKAPHWALSHTHFPGASDYEDMFDRFFDLVTVTLWHYFPAVSSDKSSNMLGWGPTMWSRKTSGSLPPKTWHITGFLRVISQIQINKSLCQFWWDIWCYREVETTVLLANIWLEQMFQDSPSAPVWLILKKSIPVMWHQAGITGHLCLLPSMQLWSRADLSSGFLLLKFQGYSGDEMMRTASSVLSHCIPLTLGLQNGCH